jgi:hypothetical protein
MSPFQIRVYLSSYSLVNVRDSVEKGSLRELPRRRFSSLRLSLPALAAGLCLRRSRPHCRRPPSAPEANRRRCRSRLSAPTLLIPPANKMARQGPGQELRLKRFPCVFPYVLVACILSRLPLPCTLLPVPCYLYPATRNSQLVTHPMEMRGLEPLASAVQRRRSPS